MRSRFGVDAAVAAGVTLYEGFTVDQVLLEEERVVGIRGQTQTGAPVTEQAPLVIGDDGVNSIVARTVAAAEYQTHDSTRLANFWLHGSFLQLDNAKMAKSGGGFSGSKRVSRNAGRTLMYSVSR